MSVYDVDLIMSWTPNEYKAFKKGALLQVIDDYDNMARMAVFHRIAANKKKLNVAKDLFDAKSARERISSGDRAWKESKKIDTTRHAKAQEAMKKWAENHNRKG
ncbi:hypothetical protein ACIQ1H_09185 [Lysinibacillus sp. NPDC097279]|uniref:hypothetical protein n=1 Tax=Lysinibacillus sp. NPDC097279 TaxID=3364143 RepID=UPI0038285564